MNVLYINSENDLKGIYNFQKQKIAELYQQEWNQVKQEIDYHYKQKFNLNHGVPMKFGDRILKNSEPKLQTYHFAFYSNNKLLFFTVVTEYPEYIEIWNLFSNTKEKVNSKSLTQILFKNVLSFFTKDVYLGVKKTNPYFKQACKLYINSGFSPVTFENKILIMQKENKIKLKQWIDSL